MKSLVPGPMKIVKFKNGILNPSSVGFTNSVVLKENILRFLPPLISREFFDKKRGEVEVKLSVINDTSLQLLPEWYENS